MLPRWKLLNVFQPIQPIKLESDKEGKYLCIISITSEKVPAVFIGPVPKTKLVFLLSHQWVADDDLH